MKLPKYRRHVGRNRGFVEFDGKRHYLEGPYQSPESLHNYRQFLERHGLLKLEAKSRAPVLVCEVAARFLSWCEVTYPLGSRSENSNCKAAVGHLLMIDATTAALEYGPSRIKALQQRLADAKKSRGYINAVCARVRRMFRWAASEELVPPSIYHGLASVPGLRRGRSTARETSPREAVPWESVAATLPELSPTVAAMVLFQWHTGVRPQSLCQARLEQFDRSVQPWEWRPVHKTAGLGHSLVVFVGPQAQAVLAPYLEGREPGDYLFQPRHLNGKRARGFRSFYDATSYLRAISRAQERINAARAKQGIAPLPRWTPHMIRHAKATIVRSIHGLEAAQATLGHRSISATQIYAAKQLEQARQIALASG